MPVRVLGTYGYRGRLEHEWGESMFNPAWAEIESALRRLDAGAFAGVVLHQNDYCEGEPAEDCLAVTGGPGAYLVACKRLAGRSVTLMNPNGAEDAELVAVCRRDQGVWVAEAKVCRDFDTVLTVARHYAATGEPLSQVVWR